MIKICSNRKINDNRVILGNMRLVWVKGSFDAYID